MSNPLLEAEILMTKKYNPFIVRDYPLFYVLLLVGNRIIVKKLNSYFIKTLYVKKLSSDFYYIL